MLSGDTISPLLVWVSHAAVAGVWSSNSYLKYKFVPADGISILDYVLKDKLPYIHSEHTKVLVLNFLDVKSTVSD